MEMSVETLRNSWTNVRLAGSMIGFSVNILVEVCVIVVIVAVIALEVVTSVSYAAAVRANVTIDFLTGIVLVVVPKSDLDVYVGVVSNMCAVTMTAFASRPMLASCEEAFVCSCKTLACCRSAKRNRHVLQACMPLYHVRERCTLPVFPQSPYQEPPCPQQLSLPDFLMMPHAEHTRLMGFVVVAGVGMWRRMNTKRKNIIRATTQCEQA